jgi:hypothetical protein
MIFHEFEKILVNEEGSMFNRSAARFGSVMAILAGVFLCLSTASYFFWPRSLIVPGNDFYSFVLRNTVLYHFTYLTLSFSALAGLAVVLAIKDWLYAEDHGLLRWASLLGVAAFLMTVANASFTLTMSVDRAQEYASLHDTYQGFGVRLDLNQTGEMVMSTIPDGPMDKAGLRTGDVLVKFNGKPVEKWTPSGDVSAMLSQQLDGRVILTVRTGAQAERDVTVERGQVNLWEIETQKAMISMGVPKLDANYLFTFILPGLWFLILNIDTLRSKLLPRFLACVGIAAGIAYLMIGAGFIFNVSLLTLIGQVCGLIVGPAWFIWTGLLMRKSGNP